MLFLRCRLIILSYLCLANHNPSQSLSTLSSHNIQGQLQSHYLEHSSTQSCISITISLGHICQISYNILDTFIKETDYPQDLQPVLFNLPRQFCLSLGQVWFLQTTILIERMPLLLIWLLIDLIVMECFGPNILFFFYLFFFWFYISFSFSFLFF